MLLAFAAQIPAWPATPDIVLPEPFALELPVGANSLRPDDAPVQQLLAGMQAGGAHISIAFPRGHLGPGAWRVILSAWGDGGRDRPVARREVVLVILPHGMSPVANTGYASPPHIGRDADGFVHMAWTDAWRAGAREGAMYRRGSVLQDGTVRFDTDIQDLGVNRGNWTAMPALAAVGHTVHFTWQADATIRYRSLTRDGGTWRWSVEADTQAPAPSRELAPDITATVDIVSILGADGHYLASRDGGRSWTTETVPPGGDGQVGAVSLTSDRLGRPLAAASALTEDHRTLRLARRIGAGAWQTLPGPIDICTADVPCNGFRVQEDFAGALHAVFLGSPPAGSGIEVQAWYVRLPSGGEWSPPVPLLAPDPMHGLGGATATGLLVDHELAVVLVGFALHAGWRYRGNDVQLKLFRDGGMIAPPLPVSSFIRSAMTDHEPAEALSVGAVSLAPTLRRTPDGRVWADVLTILNPTAIAAAGVVVWQRVELTNWLR